MMQRYISLLPAVFLVALLATLITALACNDPLTSTLMTPQITAPDLTQVTSQDESVSPDSTRDEALFLSPLGGPSNYQGPFITNVSPIVVVCRLANQTCSGDTIARFTTAHSTHTSLQLDKQNATFSVTLPITTIPQNSHDIYRILILLNNDSIGFRDFKLQSRTRTILSNSRYRAHSRTPSDSTYATISSNSPLQIRFHILPPAKQLTVVVEPGVHGNLSNGTVSYHAGEKINYHFTADRGYTNVLVMIDDDYASNPGTVVMDHNHLLVVSADVHEPLPKQDAPLANALRSLLRSPTATAAQQYLATLASLSDTIDLQDRLDRVEQSLIDPIRDAATLAKLNRALTNHILSVGNGSGSIDSTPSSPGGGAILSDRLASTSTLSRTASLNALTSRADLNQRELFGEEPVIIAYVNGIFTTPVGALNTASEVNRLAQSMQWPVIVPFDVRLIYNQSALADTTDSHATLPQCLAQLSRVVTHLGINSLPRFLAQCSGSPIRDMLHHLDDLTEAGRQYVQLQTQIGSAEPDAVVIADSMTRWHQELQHVLFIPHSQGNLMVQQAVNVYAQRGLYHPAQDQTCIGAVSLAAPLSIDWPINDAHLRGIAIDGDIILSLGGNNFPRIHTALSDSASADIQRWQRRGSALMATYKKITWGIRLHDVAGSYLNQDASRTVIEQAISFTYGSCALGKVTISPAQMLLNVGASGLFQTALFDINGNPLDGTRPLQWSITGFSGPTYMPISISQTGEAHAIAPGTTGIEVNAVTRHAYAGVATYNSTPF